ncbi:hypothetical protein GCM10009609_72270 [Pseudonocardia aurantiaca]|uniref:Uncharacterized protein n=1 Tax=Pseudonocardia aurantiaca TaxID=75290 RepID=A0ABW4FJZ1_9PSEU
MRRCSLRVAAQQVRQPRVLDAEPSGLPDPDDAADHGAARVAHRDGEGRAADRADYAGWNRAYRQYFANTNLTTGDTELVPLGSAEPAAPLLRNPTRPSRFALEVQSLPVAGWLVEVEVDTVFPADVNPE